MIEATSVSKAFGEHHVLTDVSLTARDGEVTGFVGPNGAGKTTLMKIIAGLIPADAGSALIDGQPFALAPSPGKRLGIHINGEWLPEKRSGEAHLRYICDTQSIPGSAIKPILERVELWGAHDRPIGTYSLGMRQRLGIAAALINDSANIMLDEPVNGLDPNGVIWLRNLLRQEAASGKAVLLSSHLMSELEIVAQRFVVLHQGKVVTSGTLEELGPQSAKPEVWVASRDLERVVTVLRDKGFHARIVDGGAIVDGGTPEQIGHVVFSSGLSLHELFARNASLEERFLASTRAAQESYA